MKKYDYSKESLIKLPDYEDQIFAKYCEEVKPYETMIEKEEYGLKIFRMWKYFGSNSTYTERIPARKGYEAYVVCAIEKDGTVLKLSAYDGEADWYSLETTWMISMISTTWLKKRILIFDDAKDVTDEMLSLLDQLKSCPKCEQVHLFYFDRKCSAFENNYQWDDALEYLEEQYGESKENSVLRALVGFSWYYFIEGPVESKKYTEDTNEMGLIIWKKYIDIGSEVAKEDDFFNFIAGYTLSLHGFLLGEDYENNGDYFLQACMKLTKNRSLYRLAENIFLNNHSKKHIPLDGANDVCQELFAGEALLEKYFVEILRSNTSHT